MADKLVKMGIKRKELHPAETAASPKSEKAYDNEEVHPEIHLGGPHAEMMGAENLKKGDRVRQTVEWVVKSHKKEEKDGQDPHYEMTLAMHKAGDQTDCEPETEEKGSLIDDGDGGDDSPAMSYIRSRAAKEG